MGKLNHYTVDNGDIEEHSSDYMPDTDQTPIKSNKNDEMDQLIELLNLEHYDDIIDVDLQMIQS